MEQQDTLAITIISNTLESESIAVNGTLNYCVLGIGLGVTILLIILYYRWVKSKQLLNYIPSIWTSLGILGTFIAIYKTLSAGNTNTLSDVDTLVRNIIPAFTTSIYGILGAILTSIAIKLIYASEEKNESDEIENALFMEERRLKGTSQFFIKNTTPEVIMFRMCNMLNENNRLIGNLLTIQRQQEQGLTTFIASHLQQLETFYDNLHKTNEQYAKKLTDEYLNGIKTIIDSAHSEMDSHIKEILSSHIQEINQYFYQELQVLNELSCEGKKIIKAIPDGIDDVKSDLIVALEKVIVAQYSQLLDGNTAFVNQLLNHVKSFESELSKNTQEEHSHNIADIKKQIESLVNQIRGILNQNEASVKTTTATLSAEMEKISSALVDSSKDYSSIVTELNRLLPIIEKQTANAEKGINNSEETNKTLHELAGNIEEIARKNQQLRYELMQWRRVHKRVKVNDKAGTKECPNCHEENLIEANFCKKCAYGFWDVETIGTVMSKN